jgi:hypothetical protein
VDDEGPGDVEGVSGCEKVDEGLAVMEFESGCTREVAVVGGRGGEYG